MNKFNFKDFYVSYEDRDDPVINSLKRGVLFGYPNAVEVMKFTTCRENKSTIIDCGAHIGTFAIPLSIIGRKVICIDGSETNIECIKDTIQQQIFNNITATCHILDKEIRACSFEDSGPFGSIVHNSENNKTSTTIDALFYDEDDLSFIKYDLEGSEIDAILGSEKTIKKYRPGLLVEVNQHCQEGHNKSVYELFELIEDFGYYIIWPIKNQYIKLNKKHHKMFPSQSVTDVVCIPHEKILNYMCKCGKCFNISMLQEAP